MVGCGVTLALVAILFAFVRWRRREAGTRLLRILALVSPLGFLALEAGWVVTEAGRQPWVIYGVMRTADGVTPTPGVPMTFFAFTVLYIALGTVLAILLRRLATSPPHARTPEVEREAAPVA
jgi:cytochrome d ubiquinol oxidase subunit I